MRRRIPLALPSAAAVICSLILCVRALSDVAVTWGGMDVAYNPSLVEYGDKYLSALKRTTFLKANHKVFWVNDLYICVGALGNIQGLRCQSYNPWVEQYLECEFDKDVRDGKTDVTGLGDVKVWVWPGRGVYTIFGRKPERVPGAGPYCTSKVVYDQWIAQVRPEQTAGPWRLQQPLRLHVTGNFKYPETPKYVMEKNWMPWVYREPNGTETLYLTHMVNPHRVLEANPSGACEVRFETNGRPDLFGRLEGHALHGGPPAVWVDGKLTRDGNPYYLGIMHFIEFRSMASVAGGRMLLAARGKGKKEASKTVKIYRHFAFKFEPRPPFTITDISDELPLTFYRHRNHPTKAFIAYVAGLFISGNGTLYVSYGAGDREARVLTLTVGELEGLFTGKVALLPNAG